jgi:glutamate-ammonia-ligase adenylyltransferase
VQYLVLGHAVAHAGLTANAGNLALLLRAAELQLIPAGDAQSTHTAYRRYRQLQHALRLRGDRYARVEPAAVHAEIAAVRRLWERVFE